MAQLTDQVVVHYINKNIGKVLLKNMKVTAKVFCLTSLPK